MKVKEDLGESDHRVTVKVVPCEKKRGHEGLVRRALAGGR